MHKFILMPLVRQNNGILLAYELKDVSSHDHLFQLRMHGRHFPYLKIGDATIVKNNSDKSFSMARMKSVSTPTFTINSPVEKEGIRKVIVIGPLMQQKYFVGTMCLGMLEVYGWVHGNFKR
jgi:hypothetical protein